MDHIVYLNSASELQQLLSGEKTMLVRASTGKKRPYGKVSPDDMLFFLSGFNSKVKAMAGVKSVVSAEIDQDLASDIRKRYGSIQALEPQRELLNKRYVILIELENTRAIVPFSLSEDVHGGPGEWKIVENIDEAIG